ncbi:MAG: two-component sensor histidine kinase, partial [Bifidobacterium pseudolongum subsp. globosum]|nr:two-component sensor histidine kinase [Bifidobacterium pseudolongum subsp. globosum]
MRAKVTGVTVAVLAIGLFSAGVGAVPFLHSAFIQQIDDSLKQQASTITPEQVFTISEVDGQLVFTPRSTIPGTMPFTAIYVSDQLVAVAGGYGYED